jgi:hypothetical protein
MVNIMMADAQEVSLLVRDKPKGADWQNTHPHELYILYHLVQQYGDRHPSLFRSHRKWKKLLPTLGEIVGVECEEAGPSLLRSSPLLIIQTFVLGLPPIEARLRLPATNLMYEVCRVQKLDEQELAQFDDHFIDHLFEMVETTRDQQDERLNYAVIKLIVSSSLLSTGLKLIARWH